MKKAPPVKKVEYRPHQRHRVIFWLIVLAALAVSFKLIWVQAINAGPLAAEARQNRTHTQVIKALRGTITDRNGKVFAASTERFNVIIDQNQMSTYGKNDKKVTEKGIPGVAKQLSPLLGMSVSELETKLTGKNGYVVLKRSVSADVKKAVRQLGIGGVTTEQVMDREYPAGAVGGNIVGFTGSDGQALAGVELTLDKTLRGTDGKIEYQRGAGGQIIPSAPISETQAINGKNVRLTIDQDVQYRAQELIAQAVQKNGTDGGSIVVINPKTGEVLAIADYPTYDPNNPAAAAAKDRGNKSISNVFEPGSTGKLITMATLFEKDKAKLDDKLTIPYTMVFGGETIKDADPHPTHQYTLAGVIKHSSNVGTVQLALRVDNETRYEYLRKFGLGEKTGIELPGESAGILHPAADWKGRTQYATAFGHGYSVTALQMTAAVGTFGNDGVLVQPHVVKSTIDSNGVEVPGPGGKQTRVVSSNTANLVRQLMDNDVLDNGKAPGSVEHYAVGGKSGTAQVPDGTYTSSFIGMAPMDNPQLIVGVFFFGVHGYHSGTELAAPVFSEMMGYSLQVEGVAPTGFTGTQLENDW